MSPREIGEILLRYARPYQPQAEPESLGGAGGLSGVRLWRYRCEAGLVVLRAWPPHAPGRAHLEQVHRWLSLAVDLGFIPAPIADQTGRTLQEYDGRFWELAPWMTGAQDTARPPAPGRLVSAFTALAEFHQHLCVERREGLSPGLGQRYETITQLLRGGLETLERAVELAIEPHEAGRGDTARRWIRLARLIAPRLHGPLGVSARRAVTLQPCLRDARPEHFLFQGDRITGLVDFGAMGIDCVAGDLARLLGEWLVDDPLARSEALAAYTPIRPLSAAETELIAAFESSAALLIGEHWIRWHYVDGRPFDDPQAVTQGITRGLAYLERLAVKDNLISGHSR